MRKSVNKFLIILLLLLLVLPSMLTVVSLADDESEDEDVDLWATKRTPAYMSAVFNSVGERLRGDGNVIPEMDEMLILYDHAIYVDPLTGEVVCLKLIKGDDGEYLRDEYGILQYSGYYSTNPHSTGQSAYDKNSKTDDSVKQTLLSQIILKYTENNKESTLNSYKDAAVNDQITVKDIRNGIRVEYTLGREEVKYLVPRLIRYDKWMQLLMDIRTNSTVARNASSFWAMYTVQALSVDQLNFNIDPTTLSEEMRIYLYGTKEEAAAAGMNTTLGRYGIILNFEREIRGKEASETLTAGTLRDYPCTENFAVMSCDSTIKKAKLKELESYIKQYTDYTYEQMSEDHNETDYQGTDKIPALFKLALEYTLDEDGLNIRLNAGNIRFDNSNYKLSSINLLPYAGAADTHNNGYIFYPDGSGAIIDLASIYGKQFTTTSMLYGQDPAYREITGANREDMRYPAFGVVEMIKSKETIEQPKLDDDGNDTGETEEVEIDVEKSRGYFAILTEGDSLSKLTVDSGGKTHMYASVSMILSPRPKDTYVLQGGITASSDATWTVESKRKYTGDYRLKIYILDSNDASYSGMAEKYRGYLEKNGIISKIENTSEDIPLYIKTLGAIESSKTILGIPVDVTLPLSSFEKTKEMLENFINNKDITNIKLIMEGWANDGMNPYVATEVVPVKELGGKKGFQDLVDYTKEKGIDLFPNLDFVLFTHDKFFDGFTMSKHLMKSIDRSYGTYRTYDYVYQGYGNNGYGVISPNAMEYLYDLANEDYKNYNVGGIAVLDMGYILSTDFNEKAPLHREDSKKIVTKLLAKMQSENEKVLVQGGNAYTLPYVTDIVEFPTEHSGYKYAAASVPFYAMVLHGYVEYAGIPINLAGDYKTAILKTIENGANPYYVLAIENTGELKKQSYNWDIAKYFSINYNILLDSVVETYNALNEELKGVKNSTIKNHEYVDENYSIVKVTYENGTIFYLNYSLKDYTLTHENEEITIKAENFVRIS